MNPTTSAPTKTLRPRGSDRRSIMNSVFVHPLADVAECSVGEGTRIWQYVVVLAGANIGRECNVCAHVVIEGDVVIGNRVTIKSGVQLWNGLRVEDDVFIGPNATFTNDPFPRSQQWPEKYAATILKSGASIGANATILCGITIGRRAMIGAGSVVTRDVPDGELWVGNPAKKLRLVHDACE